MQRLGLTVGFVLSTLTAIGASHGADNPAVGRWDLSVMVSATYKPPAWLEIRQEGDKFMGRFCGEVSGVINIGEVTVEGDTIQFQAKVDNDVPEYIYKGRIKNDLINGTCLVNKGEKKGTEYPLIGIKFIPSVDPTGEWRMKIGEGEATLSLRYDKKELAGKLHGRTSGEVGIASLKGENLSISLKNGEKTFRIEARIKGDIMEGSLEPVEGKAEKFTAKRERQWGEPVKLFNGKDLDGWETMDPPGEKAENKWTAVDGVLTNTGGGKNIRTRQKFGDFKLHLEFRVPPKGNSGVYLRGRYEVQIHDSAGKEPSKGSCGAVYSRIAPSTNPAKPAGEWQTFDITLVGQYLTVVHNGKTTIENQELEGITGGAIDSNEHEPGPIYFQGDHGKIEYRNIVLTPAK
ncbi:MAG TPA: DUF1080 domain-containing protein [Phycisphaerae bacterium]|nr:DUF1080 domain-containing protein [Phycisphaerae bacterium]